MQTEPIRFGTLDVPPIVRFIPPDSRTAITQNRLVTMNSALLPTRDRHCLMAGLIAIAFAVSVHAAPTETLQFNRDIRPILAENCLSCHGPGKQSAGLRLDLPESATRPTKSGATPIVAGKPEASEVSRRMNSKDTDEVMPPPSSRKTLSAAQKETLRRWIAEGGAFQPHWSFDKLVKPTLPAGVSMGHPVDAFLNERIARTGLKVESEASRSTLIRRVAFTLTGLPPTPAEVDRFLADQSPNAYERMVDHFLSSPRFGEEMARHWLDLARYGDTHGLHLDNERSMWPYRDWVVRAFNANKPFDQFTVEQLAGDLLPNPSIDQLVATGFIRCNVTTGEGGSIDAEWHYRNAVERASAAASSWLGLTAGCAQCHDHKFDPLSAKEFYSLYAFFYSAAGSALDGNVLLHEPSVKLTTPELDRQLKEMADKVAALNADIDSRIKSTKYVDPGDAAILIGAATVQAAVPADKSFRTWLNGREGIDRSKLPKEIGTILAIKDGKWNAAQVAKLREYYLQSVCAMTRDTFAPLIRERDRLVAERTKLDAAIPASMIFRDSPTPRDAFVMIRGQYDKPGEKVMPGVPATLPPLKPAGARATRLDLARWLVSPSHPLTARVYVNRIWQQVFGTGLVKTSDDFGAQGDPPSHPELLDWLAANFRDGGWDVKALVRLLVTSDAFRRSQRVSPETLARDPENRLYARGPRVRLDAEQVRDNALFVAGLLDLTVGGKGVKPYQPDNIWEPVAFTGSNTQFYRRDNGSALYRRTLYTFFKRTAPPPFMANLDTPNREQSCSRRDRSNTPLQALQLMNDVQHFEAARALAERIMTEGGTRPEERIGFAFHLLLARAPAPKELSIVLDELNVHLARFAKSPDDAKKAIAHGESKPRAGHPPPELAAYTLVANMLLNLDETLTRN